MKIAPFILAAAHESTEQTLINDLMRGYNKDAHPIPVQNKSIYAVTFGLELVQLVNVVSHFKSVSVGKPTSLSY